MVYRRGLTPPYRDCPADSNRGLSPCRDSDAGRGAGCPESALCALAISSNRAASRRPSLRYLWFFGSIVVQDMLFDEVSAMVRCFHQAIFSGVLIQNHCRHGRRAWVRPGMDRALVHNDPSGHLHGSFFAPAYRKQSKKNNKDEVGFHWIFGGGSLVFRARNLTWFQGKECKRSVNFSQPSGSPRAGLFNHGHQLPYTLALCKVPTVRTMVSSTSA
jgi:hypothetical protein